MSAFQHFDEPVYERLARAAQLIGRWYFRYELRGLRNLPDGPCLVVGNHSGLGFVEEALLLGAWHQRHGTDRRAWGLIHDFFFHTPPFSHYYRAIGAIPASVENATAALRRGDVVLVFPGGDLDCCRPFYEPQRVHFGNRRGYARLALETGVPIVPLATTGSHWTWTFLPGGRTLAKIPLLRRLFRTDRLPIPTAFATLLLVFGLVVAGVLSSWWLLPTAVLAILPTPVRITSEVGPVLDPRALATSTTSPTSPDAIERVHAFVHGRLEAMTRHRRCPDCAATVDWLHRCPSFDPTAGRHSGTYDREDAYSPGPG